MKKLKFGGKFGPWIPRDAKDKTRLSLALSEIRAFIDKMEKRGLAIRADIYIYLEHLDIQRRVSIEPVVVVDKSGKKTLVYSTKYRRVSRDTGIFNTRDAPIQRECQGFYKQQLHLTTLGKTYETKENSKNHDDEDA